MIAAGPANLQRVPSPLLFIGRRGGSPFVAELAAARVAAVAVAYLAGISSAASDTARAGVGMSGPIRRTQTGLCRRTQSGGLRVLPLRPIAAARAEPILSVTVRTACVSAVYAASPTAEAAESGRARVAAIAAPVYAAALAPAADTCRQRTAVTAATRYAAALRSTSRTARQRTACVAATYAPA